MRDSRITFFAYLSFLLIFNNLIVCQERQLEKSETYERMPVLPPPRSPMPPISNNNLQRGWGKDLMQTAKSFVASPAGQLAMSMAKEFMARSYGGNQVLSLNISSLLTLVLLKALIFTTGLMGAGNWNQYARGRVLEGGIK
jgi:hypothetical protein